MLRIFSPGAIVPAWVIVFALFAFFASPMTLATGVLLLMVGMMPAAIMLNLRRQPSLAVVAVLPRLEASRTGR